ncbi:hypothetical protein C5167_043535 [Papaver somniferum]|uniref:Uncharacterized protein n=1 Tax=Papaver somniferum TaxID=3469 RepID=A0A4Y7L9X1_PAPSO|nr:hypothetical protein C5167_043535 [Papaver somniferum]
MNLVGNDKRQGEMDDNLADLYTIIKAREQLKKACVRTREFKVDCKIPFIACFTEICKLDGSLNKLTILHLILDGPCFKTGNVSAADKAKMKNG